MRAVVQRVTRASVSVDGRVVGAIGHGILVLLGVASGDTDKDAEQLAERAVNLRIFADEAGHMNRSVLDVRGGILAVSQFTLLGDARKGRRPSFIEAAPPEEANRLYELFVARARDSGLEIACGVFRAAMDVELVNHGPVTILLDSRRTF